MAKNVVILYILLLLSALAASKTDQYFAKKIPPSSLGLKKEKLTHLHFYFHDRISGNNVTAVRVAAAATLNTTTFFSAVVVMDDPLTVTPDVSSKTIGKAQGIFTGASQGEMSFLMVLNMAFTDGKFNGSTLSVLGRNSVFSEIREMPIVGGSGVFRFARGYAQAKTHTFDLTTFNAVVEYNVYVYHY